MTPTALVCGYLGAGKTTFINVLLRTSRDRRLVVLVNDFGGINIDKALIVDESAGVLHLENGCACCTIQESLGESLDQALAMAPDGIVIEASGVALPQRIAAYVDGWPGIRLANSITLVDCLNLDTLWRDKFVSSLVRDQIRGSSRIVFTKTDLATPDQYAAARARASRENPTADRSMGVASTEIEDFLDEMTLGVDSLDRPSAHIAFDTVTFEASGEFDRQALTDFVTHLSPDVWRVKGFAWCSRPRTAEGVGDVAGEGGAAGSVLVAVQRVGSRSLVDLAAPASMDIEVAERRNTLVLIAVKGRVDLEPIVEALHAMVRKDR